MGIVDMQKSFNAFSAMNFKNLKYKCQYLALFHSSACILKHPCSKTLKHNI